MPSPQYVEGRRDYTSDRKKENERKLMEDTAEVEVLQNSLDKTKALADEMVTMLSSFDERLKGFETSILPIHKSTQRLNRLYENIDKSLAAVQNIISYFDLTEQEEQVIMKGPNERDLVPYLTSLGKLTDALGYLNQSKFKSGEKAVYKMRQLVNTGYLQLVTLFRKWLSAHSSPIEPQRLNRSDAPDPPSIPPEVLRQLADLSAYLIAASSDVADISKTYSDVRASYLTRSMQPLASASTVDKERGRAGDNVVAGTDPSATYKKGTAGYIDFTKWLLRILQVEKKQIMALFDNQKIALKTYELTVSAVMDLYIETGETILAKVKRNTGKHDFLDIFLLFDVLENINKNRRDVADVFELVRSRSDALQEMLAAWSAMAMKCLPEFMEEVKHSSPKTSTLPPDGTVHELTTNTLGFLRRLLDYPETTEMMLNSLGEATWSSSATDYLASSAQGGSARLMRRYLVEVLNALESNLENKSRQYKKSVLTTLFMLNNYQYLLKTILSHSRFSAMLGSDVEQRFEKQIKGYKNQYQDSWKPVIEHLMDVTVIQGGHIKTSMSNSERTNIKDRFKSFNDDFEDICKVQRTYVVPDADLRSALIREVKMFLLPMYDRFLSKYQNTEFSKHKDKYIRFDRPALESMCDRLFDGNAAR
ncbi:exocyst complex component exo70 [Sorochytrium milnesiophthora]